MKFDPELHVEIEEIVSNGDICQLFGVTPAVVSNWKARFDGFPEPIRRSKSGRGTLYRKNDILRWYASAFPERMAAARALISIIDNT